MIGFNYTTLAIIVSAIIGLYSYLTRNFNYWSSRGIKGPRPIPVFGNIYAKLTGKFQESEVERLKKYGSIYGVFEGSKPVLTVADPELIKNIMIKDFNIFVNRQEAQPFNGLLDRSLSLVVDDEWKHLRSVVSPTFTTGKIRKMFELVEDCAKSVDKILENAAKEGNDIEMKKLMGNYTMDVIARCAFATKTDTHNDPNNPFVTNTIKLFSGQMWRNYMFMIMKNVMKMFNISVLDPSCEKFFMKAIQEIVKQRNDDKSGKHHDFLQLMINAQKKVDNLDETDDQLMDVEAHHGMNDNSKVLTNGTKMEITDEDILANGFLFFLAGYETTAKLLSHLTYLLALNPDSQQKLCEEVMSKSDVNGNIDYETIIQLTYLDACISEALRIYAPAPQTSRIPSEDYKLGETGITLKKGTLIMIPIHAIHHNPEYYPKPEDFIPERFMPENRDKLIPYTYLPFGAGPRNCVGMRFALMEAKTVVAKMITKYEFIRTNNTKVPLQTEKGKFAATDITVGIKRRNNRL